MNPHPMIIVEECANMAQRVKVASIYDLSCFSRKHDPHYPLRSALNPPSEPMIMIRSLPCGGERINDRLPARPSAIRTPERIDLFGGGAAPAALREARAS
jgi:hypothetical protein